MDSYGQKYRDKPNLIPLFQFWNYPGYQSRNKLGTHFPNPTLLKWMFRLSPQCMKSNVSSRSIRGSMFRDYLLLKVTIAVFGMSVFWQKVLKNWCFKRNFLHKFVFFPLRFWSKKSSRHFSGRQVGMTRRLKTKRILTSSCQWGSQIQCNERIPWISETNCLP